MSDQIASMVDHYFREEYGKVVSFLTTKFGPQHLELVEDSVQEALIKAMQTWPFSSVPKNPSGWIVRVASNKMIDALRKNSRVAHEESIPEETFEEEIDLNQIRDDVVKMMFATCHPSLSIDHQLILTLKILGGLSIREISRALLKKEETVAKSYTRAKKKFQEEGIALEFPERAEIKNRLHSVLQIIYLLFSEGYKSTEGDHLIKRDLCNEAIRLAVILSEADDTNVSITHSLLALMYFHSSRFDSRLDDDGKIVTLEFQDRSKWDHDLIQKGRQHLIKATAGSFLNEFYLQATISGFHCQAKTYHETNWPEILGLYNTLYRLNPSPIVRLNRTVALAHAESVDAALEEINLLEKDDRLSNFYLLHAIKGDLLSKAGALDASRVSLGKAVCLTDNLSEKEHLKNKIRQLSTQ